ncbi:MAG: beta-galactosidase [Candidatus Hydrogenedentes bacterium]|nr:beta-galactosidase [Candidatus Hydrogenedentota bacterium]
MGTHKSCRQFLLYVGATLFAAAAAELTTEVKNHLGSPTLFVNGAPTAPLMLFGWDRGPGPTVTHLGTEWRKHHVTFTAPEDNDGNCGVHLRFGNASGTVWLDDVQFYEGEYRPNAGENRLKCGDWECDRTAADQAWRLFVKIEAGAEASWAFDHEVKHGGAQSCRLAVAKPGNDPMHVHFYQTGLAVEKGKTYTFSAWIKADRQRTGDMMALHHGPPWTIYSGAPDSWLHKQVKMAAAEGVHIHSFGISRPWPKPGEEPDFAAVDAVLEGVINADPEALLLPRFGCDPPGWWYDEHPDEALRFDDDSRRPVCVASEVWREEMLRNVRALVEHCEGRYGEHMLGYHPCAQHTGEWFYPKTWEARHCGFSPAMQRGFSAWLRKKYHTQDALRAAWIDSQVTFDTVAVPTVEERVTASVGIFRDPAREQKTIDFFDYLQVAMVEPLELIAATVKDACDRKKIVTFFYGYYFEISGLPLGPQTSGHLALARLLECPDVDIVCSPISYGDRGLGGIGAFMVPVDSVREHGKLWLNEDDTRTFLTPEDAGYGRVATLDHTRWVHQRNFSRLLPRRLACWYMDLGGAGWLADERIWQNVGKLRAIYEKNLARPATWSPEVAVIVDEVSPSYLVCNPTVMRPIGSQFRRQLYRMGTPFRQYLLSDLVAGRVPEHKAYIFIGCFRLNRTQREAVAKAVSGKTAIWMYGSGFLEDRPDTRHITELLGMPVREVEGDVPGMITADLGAALCGGLSDTPFGVQTALDPLWAIEEGEDIEVLGHFPNGAPGAGLKRGESALTVYIGTLNAPAKLLRNILAASGVHVYIDSDDVLVTDGQFLSVTASTSGAKEVALPEKSVVRRLLPEARDSGVSNGFTEEFEKGETRFYWVEGK